MTMTNSVYDTDGVARTVFAGLAPRIEAETPAVRERGRFSRGMMTTGSVLLAGSMAAVTFNLTAPLEPVSAKPQLKPKGATAEPRQTVRDAMASVAASTARSSMDVAPQTAALAAPATYRVVEGDTVSAIAGRFGLSTASVLALNGLGWSSLIFPGQQLSLATAVASSAPSAEVTEATPSGRYTIVAGDTISGIAERHGVSTLSVLTANGLGWGSIIYPGQTLSIPGSIGPGSTMDDTATPPTIEEIVPVVATEPITPEVVIESAPPAPVEPPAEQPAAPPPAVNGSYSIVAGDTLSAIAARFGITTQALLDANGMDWSTVIYSGRTLVIPGVSSPAWSGGTVTGLDAETAANAAIIVQVGRELGVSDYGIVIALATAMQESSMRNLSWGDRDSVGLFQQRPSSGWGSVEQLTTPSHAARLFYGGPSNPNRGYTRGLLDISGWESMPLTEAAQRVQISAHPDAYAKWEASAWVWLAELG
jgi:LysM repeat protein